MGRWFIGLFVAFTLASASVQAQVVVPPDSAGLRNGEGMGMAMYADMNGYPGPKHILDLKDKLGLTKDQQKKVEDAVKLVKISATTKGDEIIVAEQELFSLFKSGKVNEKTLRLKLENIGKLRGELRYIHLQAHVRMKQILSAGQIQQYYESRSSESK
jgi:Spy/CpxP family protein refolding chaperone